jgi:class I fructose-bisphosphate aldolase
VTQGPIAGLINIQQTIKAVVKGGANAIILHKGLVDLLLRIAVKPVPSIHLEQRAVDSSMRSVALRSKEGMMSHLSPESTQSVKRW